MARKFIVFLVGVLILIYTITGCDNKKEVHEKPVIKKVTNKITELKFWTFQESYKTFMDVSVQEWNKKYENDQINLKVDVFSYDDMENKLLLALKTGTGAPDMIDFKISKYASLLNNPNHGLLSLNQVIDPEMKNLFKAKFKPFEKNGKYYGIDYCVGAVVMYYNVEIMEKANVNIDRIETWTDYIEVGKRVVEKMGIPMTTCETNEYWTYYPLISQRGSDFFSDDGNTNLDSKVNIECLKFIYDMMYKDKIAVAAPGGMHCSPMYYEFMNKACTASVMMPIWYMNNFAQYIPDLKGKIAVRAIPAWDKDSKRTAGMSEAGTSITSQCKDKNLAMKFLGYAKFSKEGSRRIWTMLGLDPIRKDVWGDPKIEVDNNITKYFGKNVTKSMKSIKFDVNPVNYTPKYLETLNLVQKSIMPSVLKEREKTPEEALKEAAKQLKR